MFISQIGRRNPSLDMDEIVHGSELIVMLILMVRGHIVVLIGVNRLGKICLYKHWVDHPTLGH